MKLGPGEFANWISKNRPINCKKRAYIGHEILVKITTLANFK